MKCLQILEWKCPKGHKKMYECHGKSLLKCKTCDDEAKAADYRALKAFEMLQKRQAAERQHASDMATLQQEIDLLRKSKEDQAAAEERLAAVEQKKADLQAAKLNQSQKRPDTPAIETSGLLQEQPESTNPSRKRDEPKAGDRSKESSPTKKTSLPATDHSKSVSNKPPTERVSPSVVEWERQKRVDNASNSDIDSIMKMIGLEAVKAQVLAIKSKIDIAIRQNSNLKHEKFNVAMLGNPGTGKTTVARLYAKILISLQVLSGTEFVETTGSRLANEGVPALDKILKDILAADGGVLFVDEAYQLVGKGNFGGGAVLDFLLAEIENNVGKIVFIFAGYNKEMEKFFEHNPGIPRRIPYNLKFADYEDDELLRMLVQAFETQFQGRMQIENGSYGLYMRIATRRLGRKRGSTGFGNAGDVKNLAARIHERQAVRIQGERKQGGLSDDFFITKEDLIGPEPSKAILTSKAWNKLNSMIGIPRVKQSIKALVDTLTDNYHRELAEKQPIQVSLNRVFLGNPGTGKTTVAKLYGQILAEIGMLSKAEGRLVAFIALYLTNLFSGQ
jgi:energy-coupling factor transporter ATP-binding protein EcfA2